jgi:hypothetical protein
MSVHVPVVTWRSVRSDVVPRVLWGLPENIAADIRLVGPWCSLSGPCNGPLRTSTCMVTRQPSAQITWHPTSAALADIRSQRTMPSACGGARPSSSAVRTEPASVPVSFRPPGCSPTTDLARFGSAVQRLSRAASRSVTGLAVLAPIAVRRASDSVPRLTAHVCFAASGAGRSPRVVMDVLDQSQLSITMDLYSHVMPSALRDAADAMDRALNTGR